MTQPQRIAILGATGSIGQSTLDVVRHFRDRFHVEAITAGSGWEALLDPIREFKPRVVAMADRSAARSLREALTGQEAPEILEGPDAAIETAALPGLDLLVNGLVGSVGLHPTLTALENGTSVAIANKEPLVAAGEIVLAAAREGGSEILPLDSELSAIHQCLRGNSGKSIRKVLLTASGGPFRTLDAADFESITPEDALSHPTWQMGPKISVDSATLMNKGLEIIETHFYFGIPYSSIDVVVHPQSLIHSMVEFVDHSVMAQISEPDMRLPIQYALTHPERLATQVRRLDLVAAGQLTFEEPDLERFPCLGLARAAGESGGTAPAVLNAANEMAVEAFLSRQIRFPQIAAVIEECLDRCTSFPEPTFENFQIADGFTRDEARSIISKLAGRAKEHVT